MNSQIYHFIVFYMGKNKKESNEQAKIDVPPKVSTALKFLRIFQPQSFIGLILFAIFLQINYYISRIFKWSLLHTAIYILNIFLIFHLFEFLPSNFIDFLFPSIPVICILKPTTKTLNSESNNNITHKNNDNDSISVLFGKKNILEDQYFQDLLNYIDLTRGAFKINSRILDKFTLLTISGVLSAFFAFLLLFRSFPFFFILHLFAIISFIFSCLFGFRVIRSIRSYT